MRIIFIVSILTYSSFIYSQNKLQFISEDITFEIRNDTFFVDGIYYFQNSDTSRYESIIAYPFPNESYTGKSSLIQIDTDSSIAEIEILEINKERLLFKLKCKKEFVYCHIQYNQEILKDTAKYIVRSAKSWGQALESADFKLICNKNDSIEFLTYKPDSQLTKETKKVYFWHMKNFIPFRDFIFVKNKARISRP